MKHPSVALVYDWVTSAHGGAERVLLALHKAFPDAPLYTSVADVPNAGWAATFDLRPSWLQKLPWIHRHHRWLAPLLPLAFESLDLSQYQVVISVTSAEAKGVVTSPDQLHICYLLTPPRYLYSHSKEYGDQLGNPALRLLANPFLKYLRWWDQASAYRPDVIFPISNLVADRCHTYYQRRTEPALYPPVGERNINHPGKDEYYLVVSRLVPYKKIDLVIKACLQLRRKLVVIGTGLDLSRLEKLSGQSELISFLSSQTDEQVAGHITNCQAVLMPGLEDFGITAAEAVSAGKPAVVHHQSGVAEILSNGKTAIFIKDETVPALVTAIEQLEKKTFNPSQLRQSMRKYATTTFVKKWQEVVMDQWSLFQEKGLYERQ